MRGCIPLEHSAHARKLRHIGRRYVGTPKLNPLDIGSVDCIRLGISTAARLKRDECVEFQKAVAV